MIHKWLVTNSHLSHIPPSHIPLPFTTFPSTQHLTTTHFNCGSAVLVIINTKGWQYFQPWEWKFSQKGYTHVSGGGEGAWRIMTSSLQASLCQSEDAMYMCKNFLATEMCYQIIHSTAVQDNISSTTCILIFFAADHSPRRAVLRSYNTYKLKWNLHWWCFGGMCSCMNATGYVNLDLKFSPSSLPYGTRIFQRFLKFKLYQHGNNFRIGIHYTLISQGKIWTRWHKFHQCKTVQHSIAQLSTIPNSTVQYIFNCRLGGRALILWHYVTSYMEDTDNFHMASHQMAENSTN